MSRSKSRRLQQKSGRQVAQHQPGHALNHHEEDETPEKHIARGHQTSTLVEETVFETVDEKRYISVPRRGFPGIDAGVLRPRSTSPRAEATEKCWSCAACLGLRNPLSSKVPVEWTRGLSVSSLRARLFWGPGCHQETPPTEGPGM